MSFDKLELHDLNGVLDELEEGKSISFEDLPMETYQRSIGISRSKIWTAANDCAKKCFVEVEETKAMRFGSAVHDLAWRKDVFEKRNRPNGLKTSTKKDGINFWSTKDWQKLQAMEKALNENGLVRSVCEGGKNELSCFWKDHGIVYKCRFDVINEVMGLILDFKFSNVNPRRMPFHIPEMGYHVQALHYTLGANAHFRKDFDFIICSMETDHPHLIDFYAFDDEYLEMAKVYRETGIKRILDYKAGKSFGERREDPRFVNILRPPKFLIENAKEFEGMDETFGGVL